MTLGLVNPNAPLCAQLEQVALGILWAIDPKKGQVSTLWPSRYSGIGRTTERGSPLVTGY